MTTPAERATAVLETRKFLFDLLNPKVTPKVPKAIRKRAYVVLKHYPWDSDIKKSAERMPKIWEITKKE